MLIINNKIELFYYFATLSIILMGFSILKEKEINIIKNEKNYLYNFGCIFYIFISFYFC